MADGPAVKELIASVRGNVDVARDAMRGPATEDSHHIVSDLMLEIKQSQEALQKKASELAETGRFDNTNEIFETIDLVGQLEPEFADWSKGAPTGGDHNIGASIHVDAHEPQQDEAPQEKTKKKKKKKKRRDSSDANPEDGFTPPETGDAAGWEAFPVPPATSSGLWGEASPPPIPAASVSFTPAPAVIPRRPSLDVTPPAPTQQPSPVGGVMTLGMKWETIGPLLGDPGSSDSARKERLGELIKEAIATECGITLDRIRIKAVAA